MDKLATLHTQDTGRRNKTKTQHYTQRDTNNLNKTWVIARGKDEPIKDTETFY
jgi:hypothetical protein